MFILPNLHVMQPKCRRGGDPVTRRFALQLLFWPPRLFRRQKVNQIRLDQQTVKPDKKAIKCKTLRCRPPHSDRRHRSDSRHQHRPANSSPAAHQTNSRNMHQGS